MISPRTPKSASTLSSAVAFSWMASTLSVVRSLAFGALKSVIAGSSNPPRKRCAPVTLTRLRGAARTRFGLLFVFLFGLRLLFLLVLACERAHGFPRGARPNAARQESQRSRLQTQDAMVKEAQRHQGRGVITSFVIVHRGRVCMHAPPHGDPKRAHGP